MNIVVFGAGGPTGRLVAESAVAQGHCVTAVTRRPQAFPLAGPLVRVFPADVEDPDAVGRAVAGQDAVVSTLGVPFGRKPVTVYSTGALHITQAMAKHRVTRLVCVTSTSISGQDSPGETVFFRKALEPFIVRFVGRTVYDDMRRSEEIVRRSGTDWTIVRPAGLFDTPDLSDYRMAPGPRLAGRFTSRTDLADALLRQVVQDSDVRAVVEVRTLQGVPSMLDIIRKEAFGRRATPAVGNT